MRKRVSLTTGLCALFLAGIAHAALPPRTQWHATASSDAVPALAPANAIDSDETTRWGGSFSADNWLQLDMGKAAAVGGVRIHWDSGFAQSYSIQTSLDGKTWKQAYATTDSKGGTDYIFFPQVEARYLRLASAPRTADWGVSVFEFEPLSAEDSPRIKGLAGKDPASIWTPSASRVIEGKAVDASAKASHSMVIQFPRAFLTAGVEVTWAGPRGDARLEQLDASGHWATVSDDPGPEGETSYLAASEAFSPRSVRLVVQGIDGKAPEISRLSLLGPARVMTPMKRYEIVASRAHADLFPSSLHQMQVYWTVVGIPAGPQKSIFDEYGNIEAARGMPLVQPVWRDTSGHAVSAAQAKLTQTLRDRWMPMPAVEWTVQPGLTLRSEAFTRDVDGQPVTEVRHRLQNTGSTPIDGSLSLIVRPMQMNPPWQNGGVSAIHDLAVDDGKVNVNGKLLMQASTTPTHAAVSAFGAHGEGEITAFVAAGKLPDGKEVHDDSGLASGALSYTVHLAPGEHRDVVVAFPLLGRAVVSPADGFDARADAVADDWRKRLGNVGIQLPDESLVDVLRSQAAYMLINQTGHAMQAGPRNYDRSFIRDGAATSSILLRMGQARVARDYLTWYASHAVHENGLVSPILNQDGSVNRGFGSDIEYDSQGEFITLVADVARLDGGAGSVRELKPKVEAALKFLQVLRERTMVPGYLADQPAPERFHGIIAPSISHEGYSSPTHSYWDDYWALKGWHDGLWLAERWGDKALADYAGKQYQALRESVAASIRSTMAWKGSDSMPSDADLGGNDPTSVSIGLDPAGQQDIMPPEALKNTFDRYLADVRARRAPGSLYAYTPYEIRNVLTYVRLDRPDVANELLEDFVHDRRPLGWNVFAEVVHSRLRHPGYLGDMPHTWIGSEYARAIFGMLMREADDGLYLLPGVDTSWVEGEGLAVQKLPTEYGLLTMTARRENATLTITLGDGIRKDSHLRVFWPGRMKPAKVTVDGKTVTDYTADGVRLEKPFKVLKAQWQ